MSFAPYRHVLAIPGVRALLLVGVVARIPSAAIGISLTLYVANTLERSWTEAGLVTAMFTVGSAIGLPMMGRLIDRRGMRSAMVLSAAIGGLIWYVAPHVAYPVLVPLAFVGGVFGLPSFSAIRVALAALIPPDQRRPAFALDSMIVELSFMVGPALAVVLGTALPGGFGLYALATGIIGAAALMFVVNPPTRPLGDELPAVRPPRSTWFGARLVSLLVVGVAAMFILSATDLAIVATMREQGAVAWTGLAIALWCAYSLVGGLIYGAVHRPISVLVLVAAMGLLTVPVGLVPSWPWLLVALIPCGALCAPTMAANNDSLARTVPANSRGEATGLLGSATTAGATLGAPVAGFVIDHAGSTWAFAVCGAVGAIAVLAALPAYRRAPTLQPSPAPAVG